MKRTAMCASGRTCLAALISGLVLSILPARAENQEFKDSLAEGKRLFERQFEATEPDADHGDGLGPVFNHVSCAGCHQQGGIGGAGPVDVNAAMLSVDLTRLDTPPDRSRLVKALREVHPAFVSDADDIAPSVILHRFGTDPRYAAMRAGLVGAAIPFKPDNGTRKKVQNELSRRPIQPLKPKQTLRLVVTQRNTSALFGAGLIDRIPDATLHALANAQSDHPEVSGRVAPVNLDKAGRFGWRGQTEHLHDFVLGACANELGLQVPGTPQPPDPLRPDYRPTALDLSADGCKSLTAFVASLPPPKLDWPQDSNQRKIVEHGKWIFHSIGCSVCHVENVGPAHGIYSDLLLHDLGSALADPVLARPTLVPTDQQLISSQEILLQPGRPVEMQSSPQYYGGSTIQSARFASGAGATTFRAITGSSAVKTEYSPLPANLAQEWRTPPLWGLGDSAPYLHDGRAATVVEAIALHGGEADACMKRYFAHSVADRMAMLQFLNCLRAP